MTDLRDTCEGDRAAERAASAARTLAAIAHDAARKYIERDVVAPSPHGLDPDMVTWIRSVRQSAIARMGAIAPPWDDLASWPAGHVSPGDILSEVDTAERERQARLRRWHEPPHPNRKGR